MGFEGNYKNAGERGVSVLAQKEHMGIAEPRFFIQVRSVSANDQPRLRLEPADIPVSLVTEIGMRFCPWCGVNLGNFYGKDIASLHRPSAPISN
jgi:hypothetical protein